MVRGSKYFEVCFYFPRQTYLPHPLTATLFSVPPPTIYFFFINWERAGQNILIE